MFYISPPPKATKVTVPIPSPVFPTPRNIASSFDLRVFSDKQQVTITTSRISEPRTSSTSFAGLISGLVSVFVTRLAFSESRHWGERQRIAILRWGQMTEGLAASLFKQAFPEIRPEWCGRQLTHTNEVFTDTRLLFQTRELLHLHFVCAWIFFIGALSTCSIGYPPRLAVCDSRIAWIIIFEYESVLLSENTVGVSDTVDIVSIP